MALARVSGIADGHLNSLIPLSIWVLWFSEASSLSYILLSFYVHHRLRGGERMKVRECRRYYHLSLHWAPKKPPS